MTSTNHTVRSHGDRLFDLLEEVVVTESRGNTNALLQPIVGCLSQPQNKVAKPHLVDRLSSKYYAPPFLSVSHSIVFSYVRVCAFYFIGMVERVDKQAIIMRLLNPLVQPSHRIQQEANGNVALKQALQRLAIVVQSAELGLDGIGMGIGLKGQY